MTRINERKKLTCEQVLRRLNNGGCVWLNSRDSEDRRYGLLYCEQTNEFFFALLFEKEEVCFNPSSPVRYVKSFLTLKQYNEKREVGLNVIWLLLAKHATAQMLGDKKMADGVEARLTASGAPFLPLPKGYTAPKKSAQAKGSSTTQQYLAPINLVRSKEILQSRPEFVGPLPFVGNVSREVRDLIGLGFIEPPKFDDSAYSGPAVPSVETEASATRGSASASMEQSSPAPVAPETLPTRGPAAKPFQMSRHAEQRRFQRTALRYSDVLLQLENAGCTWLNDKSYDGARYALLYCLERKQFFVAAVVEGEQAHVVKTLLTLDQYNERLGFSLDATWLLLSKHATAKLFGDESLAAEVEEKLAGAVSLYAPAVRPLKKRKKSKALPSSIVLETSRAVLERRAGFVGPPRPSRPEFVGPPRLHWPNAAKRANLDALELAESSVVAGVGIDTAAESGNSLLTTESA